MNALQVSVHLASAETRFQPNRRPNFGQIKEQPTAIVLPG